MATISFNVAEFYGLFPLFSDSAKYPQNLLQNYWNIATEYISNKSGGCYTGAMKPGQQRLALNLMTAHLTALYTQINAGQGTGLVQAATVDKVNVTLTPPPEVNQWQWWLNQTPYGQQLLALLQVASVGGFFIGGFPTRSSMRR